jgi:hypothetical protein
VSSEKQAALRSTVVPSRGSGSASP